ncbi:MAG: 2-oxoacid:acceptor oxidoreductase family protein [Deltaproteobacteria bacterium]|nr:2-oxoacid:acceptor oxidoreductase family protein [Deltaproteobacteria bacterium]
MAKVHEITVWTRGVIGDKEGRDIAAAIGGALQAEGKHVQVFDNYEDLPDRVLVTTRKYVRYSDEEIEHKYVYTNDHPEVVVIAEPTIVKGINILRGMSKGGTLIINTARDIDYMLQFIPNAELLDTIATVDADSISGVQTIDFSGSEGGVDSVGVGAGLAAPLAGAFAKVTGLVKKENLAKIVKDVAGMEKGFNDVKVKKLR